MAIQTEVASDAHITPKVIRFHFGHLGYSRLSLSSVNCNYQVGNSDFPLQKHITGNTIFLNVRSVFAFVTIFLFNLEPVY